MARINSDNYQLYMKGANRQIDTHTREMYLSSSPTVQAGYGPYDSTETAHKVACYMFDLNDAATANTPCTSIQKGFTVAIENPDGSLTEYQYKKQMPAGGYTSSDLEVKGIANVNASDVTYKSSNVETALENAESDIQQLRSDIGTMSSLETDSNRNLVGAVNEVNTKANSASTKIGTLTSLHTTNKTTVVDAINEVKDAIPTSISAENVSYNSSGSHTTGSIAEAVASAEESIQSLDGEVYNINETIDDLTDSTENLRSDVGDLSNLDTPAQNLVSAINSGITSASNSATAAAASSAAAQQASTSAVNATQSVLDELDNFPASQDATVLQHGTRITALESTSVHDLSVMYSSSYANLSAALTALDADTSATAIKVAGMSIKFINSTTNKYEQWNLKASSWSTDTSNWGNTNVTQASEIIYNGQSLSNILPPLDNISKQNTQSEEQAVIYETDGGVQIGKIDANGADFKNLKKNGQDVATENQIPSVPTLDTTIGDNPSNSHTPSTKAVKDYVDANLPDIDHETVSSEDKEIRFETDNGTLVGKVDVDGADFVSLKKDGQEVATLEDVPNIPISQETTTDTADEYEFKSDSEDVVARINPDGIHAKDYYDLSGNKIGQSLPWRGKEVFTIGDSLCAGGVWQQQLVALTGCTFDQAKNANNIAPISQGGTNTKDLTRGCALSRALNLKKMNYHPDVILLENGNDQVFFNATTGETSGSIEDSPKMISRFIEGYSLSDWESDAATLLASIPSADREVGAVIELQSLTSGINLKPTTLPSNAGTINLRITTITGGGYRQNYDYGITFEGGETLQQVLDKILEYSYIDVVDTLADDEESVDFSPPSGYTLEVNVTNAGGTGIVFTTSSTNTAKAITPKFFDGVVSEWTDVTKWKTSINLYQAWKGLIEFLKKEYPSAEIYMLIFPWYSMTPSEYLEPNGYYNQLAYNNTQKRPEGRANFNKEVAEFYNLPIIDVHHTCGITCANYSEYYNNNNVHPKNNGYAMFGRMIARQAISLTSINQ